MIPRELAFDVDEFRARLAAVRRQMVARSLDALVLFGPQNLCYVSGLDNDNLSDLQCVVVPLDRDPILVLFWFEAGRAENTCWLDEVVLYRGDEDPIGVVAGVLGRLGLAGGRLGVERPTVGLTVNQFEHLVAQLPDAVIEDSFPAVEIPRRVKSPAEIGYMRRAAALTDRALDAACAAVKVGVSDGELAAAITNVIYGEGGEVTSLGPIVAVGYRAGAPHSSFNGTRVQAGDSVFLEFTAQVRRYTAPIMRSVWLGEPSAEILRLADAGAAAVETIVRTARPGLPASEVARAARAELEPILDQVMFHNSYGYPVGIGFPPTWTESLGFYLWATNDQVARSRDDLPPADLAAAVRRVRGQPEPHDARHRHRRRDADPVDRPAAGPPGRRIAPVRARSAVLVSVLVAACAVASAEPRGRGRRGRSPLRRRRRRGGARVRGQLRHRVRGRRDRGRDAAQPRQRGRRRRLRRRRRPGRLPARPGRPTVAAVPQRAQRRPAGAPRDSPTRRPRPVSMPTGA